MAELQDNYLFRAKAKNGQWHIGLLACISNGECCIRDSENRIWYTDTDFLCLCSGLRDVNNVLMFAEDIIRDDDGCIGVLKYGEYDHSNGKILGWHVEWKSEKAMYYRQDFLFWQSQRKIEVIGNTFENKEFIKNLV